MKIACFCYDGRARLGAVTDLGIIDLRRAYAAYLRAHEGDWQADVVAEARIPADLVTLLRQGAWPAQAVARGLAHVAGRPGPWLYGLNQVALLAPVTPGTMICGGPELDAPDLAPWSEFYLKSPHAIVGPGGPFIRQRAVPSVTYEPQIAVVIGKPGRHLSPGQALDHVYGYTICLNFSSRRHLQPGWEGTMFHNRYGDGASFDTSAVLGPWVVTADELGDLADRRARLLRNGELLGEYRLGDLQRSVAEFVSYCSAFLTLEPGLLISCASPLGPVFTRAAGATPVVVHPDRPELVPGDRVEAEIGGIGTLVADVAEEA